MKGVPSAPNLPLVTCSMTDRDTLDRVAAMFGTATIEIDKGRYRTEYRTIAKGSRAVALMRDLSELMGLRRRAAIQAALSTHVLPPVRKLSFALAETIRERYRAGASVSVLAREHRVRCSTIRQLLQGRFYREPKVVEYTWRSPAPWLPLGLGHPALAPAELCWLAGWLEGEGSFLRPPPSSPRKCRIMGECRDIDVITRVGRALGVKAGRVRTRSLGRSPTWTVQKAGYGAAEFMVALRPLMGERRTEQIDAALEIMEAAGFEPASTVA